MSARFIWRLGGSRVPLYVGPQDIPGVGDIGHSLSLINRWTGWTRWPWSVAQHTILVSYLVEPRFAMPALHHDDHECVTGDISSPLKRELSQGEASRLRELAARFDFLNPYYLFGKHFEGSPIKPAGEAIDRADLLVTYLEAIHLVQVDRDEVDAHFGRIELTAAEGQRLRQAHAALCGDYELPADITDVAFDLLQPLDWSEAAAAYLERHEELL